MLLVGFVPSAEVFFHIVSFFFRKASRLARVHIGVLDGHVRWLG